MLLVFTMFPILAFFQYSSRSQCGSFNIYLFLGFGQFWGASLQHNDTRVPKLEAYVSFHIDDKIEIRQIRISWMEIWIGKTFKKCVQLKIKQSPTWVERSIWFCTLLRWVLDKGCTRAQRPLDERLDKETKQIICSCLAFKIHSSDLRPSHLIKGKNPAEILQTFHFILTFLKDECFCTKEEIDLVSEEWICLIRLEDTWVKKTSLDRRSHHQDCPTKCSK